MLSDSFQGDRVDKNWNGINDESADAGAESARPLRLDRRSHAKASASELRSRFHRPLVTLGLFKYRTVT